MNTRLFILLLLAGCAERPAQAPAPAPAPSAPVAAAPSQPPEPTAAQVPIAADFQAEAQKAITPETYKTELASIAKELDGDEVQKAP